MTAAPTFATQHAHPLRRLPGYAWGYRCDVVVAAVCPVLNKSFHVLPGLLVGIAVDVVINRKTSFVARLEAEDPEQQRLLPTAPTIAIRLGESFFDYPWRLQAGERTAAVFAQKELT
jgi:ATP-binding cassette subfamily B protein